MEPTIEPTFSAKKGWSVFLFLAVFLLIVIGLFLYINSDGYKLKHEDVTKENVVTEKIDLSIAKGADRIPQNFPVGILVDTGTITESYSMNYVDRGATLSGLTYVSSTKVQDLYKSYVDYIVKSGYSIRLIPPIQPIKEGGVYSVEGEKGNDTLSVFVTYKQDGNNIVKLVYTDKK